MAEQMSQQEIIEQQKANCPFCKIIAGEIPTNKVYEDDLILAITDINPLAKGHLLVMPKEHYPIMPFIPQEVFSHLFGKLKFISKGQMEAAVVQKNVWFIANGGAAGQRSSHFMLHLIPREEGDELDEIFTRPTVELPPQQVQQLSALLSKNLNAALGKPQTPKQDDLGTMKAGSQTQEPPSTGVPAEQKKLLAERLEQDEGLRELLMKDPKKASENISQDEELTKLFAGVDIAALSARLNTAYSAEESEPGTEQKGELAQILEQDPELRNLLIQDPSAFQEKIKNDPKLSPLFSGVDIFTLSTKLKHIYGGDS